MARRPLLNPYPYSSKLTVWLRRDPIWSRLVTCVEHELKGSGRSPRGRPERHRGEVVLYHVLAALDRTETGWRYQIGPARWASGWGWRAARNRPSGSQCLRRLRDWQTGGQWQDVLVVLRQWAEQDATLLAKVERLREVAEFRRTPHKRPRRSGTCSKTEHVDRDPARADGDGQSSV